MEAGKQVCAGKISIQIGQVEVVVVVVGVVRGWRGGGEVVLLWVIMVVVGGELPAGCRDSCFFIDL